MASAASVSKVVIDIKEDEEVPIVRPEYFRKVPMMLPALDFDMECFFEEVPVPPPQLDLTMEVFLAEVPMMPLPLDFDWEVTSEEVEEDPMLPAPQEFGTELPASDMDLRGVEDGMPPLLREQLRDFHSEAEKYVKTSQIVNDSWRAAILAGSMSSKSFAMCRCGLSVQALSAEASRGKLCSLHSCSKSAQFGCSKSEKKCPHLLCNAHSKVPQKLLGGLVEVTLASWEDLRELKRKLKRKQLPGDDGLTLDADLAMVPKGSRLLNPMLLTAAPCGTCAFNVIDDIRDPVTLGQGEMKGQAFFEVQGSRLPTEDQGRLWEHIQKIGLVANLHVRMRDVQKLKNWEGLLERAKELQRHLLEDIQRSGGVEKQRELDTLLKSMRDLNVVLGDVTQLYEHLEEINFQELRRTCFDFDKPERTPQPEDRGQTKRSLESLPQEPVRPPKRPKVTTTEMPTGKSSSSRAPGTSSSASSAPACRVPPTPEPVERHLGWNMPKCKDRWGGGIPA